MICFPNSSQEFSQSLLPRLFLTVVSLTSSSLFVINECSRIHPLLDSLATRGQKLSSIHSWSLLDCYHSLFALHAYLLQILLALIPAKATVLVPPCQFLEPCDCYTLQLCLPPGTISHTFPEFFITVAHPVLLWVQSLSKLPSIYYGSWALVSAIPLGRSCQYSVLSWSHLLSQLLLLMIQCINDSPPAIGKDSPRERHQALPADEDCIFSAGLPPGQAFRCHWNSWWWRLYPVANWHHRWAGSRSFQEIFYAPLQ